MKPSDEPIGLSRDKWLGGHSECIRPIRPYINKDCVVGHYTCPLGTLFFIKGKIKYFGYLLIKKDMPRARMGYSLSRMEDWNGQIVKSFKIIDQQGTIVNKKLWDRLKLTLALENL